MGGNWITVRKTSGPHEVSETELDPSYHPSGRGCAASEKLTAGPAGATFTAGRRGRTVLSMVSPSAR